MKSAVDVDDAAVQQMVESSLEHAFDDLAARRWVEAKLKAQETLTATHKALGEYAGELEPDYRGKLTRPRGRWNRPWPRKRPAARVILGNCKRP